MGTLAGEIECLFAPAERACGGGRGSVGEHRQDEALGVPERVAVVAGSGESLGGDRSLFGARARLERVEEGEAQRLLQFGIAVDLDVGAGPEVIQVGALASDEPLPAGRARGGQSGSDLIVQSRSRALARPAVGEELDDPQPLSRAHVAWTRIARVARAWCSTWDEGRLECRGCARITISRRRRRFVCDQLGLQHQPHGLFE
jgi:hypothetical protein